MKVQVSVQVSVRAVSVADDGATRCTTPAPQERREMGDRDA